MREWRLEDRQPFAELNADPQVMQHFASTLDRTASDAFLDRIIERFPVNGFGLWAVERIDTSQFIGFVGLSVPRFDAPFVPAIEVGWRLARSAWGQGFATEAGRQAIAVGFQQYQLPEIVSFTTHGNIPSQAVMRRLGMSHDPADDFEHPSLALGSPLRPHVLYRLTRENWLADNS